MGCQCGIRPQKEGLKCFKWGDTEAFWKQTLQWKIQSYYLQLRCLVTCTRACLKRLRILGDMNGVNMGLCHGMSLSIVRVITGRVWGHWLKTWYSRKFKGIQFLGEPLGECFVASLGTGRHWSSQKLWTGTASFGDSSCRTRKSQRVT